MYVLRSSLDFEVFAFPTFFHVLALLGPRASAVRGGQSGHGTPGSHHGLSSSLSSAAGMPYAQDMAGKILIFDC